MNLATAFNVTYRVAPGTVETRMGTHRHGLVGDRRPCHEPPGSTGYGAAKAGMEGMMRGLALELGPRGITANAVAPGWIVTDPEADEPDHGRFTPVGRSGTPGEIAEAVAFLSSDRASYITGQAILVDGGNTIQEIKGN